MVAVIAAATMTYGNFAALAQQNLKRMLAYSSIAHAGYMLVGVLAAVVSVEHVGGGGLGALLPGGLLLHKPGCLRRGRVAGPRQGSDDIDDLDGLGSKSPLLAVCIVLLMLSLIGLPPLAGFFGKLYMFMEALDAAPQHRLTFLWLVVLGLLNSVVSAFYYVRVLKAMFLRPSRDDRRRNATPAIATAIVAGALVAVGFGVYARVLSKESVALGRSKMFAVGGVGPTKPVADPVSMRLAK